MATIETTDGPIAADELGRTLVHEHLLSASEGVRFQYPHLYDFEAEHDRAVAWVTAVRGHGVRTIVDPACLDLARDARFAQRVAEATGVRFVLATGIYGQHYTFLPQHFQTRDEDYLADVFVHDIEVGIQGTGVKAAFIKTAADEPGMTDDMTKVHRAAARASLRTGRPIMAHSRPASRTGIAQLEIFLEEGVPADRIHIAHTGDTDDLGYIEEILAMGAWIGLDRFGTEIFLPEPQRIDTTVALLERGHVDRMMLSCDACATIDWFPPELVEQLAPRWTMMHLFEDVLPALRERGVTEEQVATMLDANPARWLGA
jgi:phosphotriesterase-related protein